MQRMQGKREVSKIIMNETFEERRSHGSSRKSWEDAKQMKESEIGD